MLCTRPVVGRHCIFKIHEMGSGSFKIMLDMKKGGVSEGFDRGEKCEAVAEAGAGMANRACRDGA